MAFNCQVDWYKTLQYRASKQHKSVNQKMNISQKKYTNKIIKDNILPNSIYFLIVGEKQMLKVWCIGKCEVEDHKDMNICVDVSHATFYYLLS